MKFRLLKLSLILLAIIQVSLQIEVSLKSSDQQLYDQQMQNSNQENIELDQINDLLNEIDRNVDETQKQQQRELEERKKQQQKAVNNSKNQTSNFSALQNLIQNKFSKLNDLASQRPGNALLKSIKQSAQQLKQVINLHTTEISVSLHQNVKILKQVQLDILNIKRQLYDIEKQDTVFYQVSQQIDDFSLFQKQIIHTYKTIKVFKSFEIENNWYTYTSIYETVPVIVQKYFTANQLIYFYDTHISYSYTNFYYDYYTSPIYRLYYNVQWVNPLFVNVEYRTFYQQQQQQLNSVDQKINSAIQNQSNVTQSQNKNQLDNLIQQSQQKLNQSFDTNNKTNDQVNQVTKVIQKIDKDIGINNSSNNYNNSSNNVVSNVTQNNQVQNQSLDQTQAIQQPYAQPQIQPQAVNQDQQSAQANVNVSNLLSNDSVSSQNQSNQSVELQPNPLQNDISLNLANSKKKDNIQSEEQQILNKLQTQPKERENFLQNVEQDQEFEEASVNYNQNLVKKQDKPAQKSNENLIKLDDKKGSALLDSQKINQNKDLDNKQQLQNKVSATDKSNLNKSNLTNQTNLTNSNRLDQQSEQGPRITLSQQKQRQELVRTIGGARFSRQQKSILAQKVLSVLGYQKLNKLSKLLSKVNVNEKKKRAQKIQLKEKLINQ